MMVYILTVSEPVKNDWYITKKRLYNFDPLKKHFYIFILIFAKKVNYEYSLEPPRRGVSNGCPQSSF